MDARGRVVAERWDLGSIADAFARAALDPMHWTDAMEVAASATASAGAVLMPVSGRLPGLPHSASLGGLLEDYFAGGWATRDLRERGRDLLWAQGAFSDLDVCTVEEIAKAPYYNDFLGQHDLRWFAGVSVACGEDLWCLCIQRSIEQGPFTPGELADLARQAPQLGSAGTIARSLGHARVEASVDALDAAGAPAVIFDRFGSVLHLNARAEALLGDDLRISGRRLVSTDRAATIALERALQALLWRPGAAALGRPVRLPRRSGRRPIMAYPLRLPRLREDPLSPAAAAMILRDLDRRPRAREEDLAAAFGLTRREAALAVHLGSGLPLGDFAERHGLSLATARVHLRATFAKTDTHRQGDLVALIARLPT